MFKHTIFKTVQTMSSLKFQRFYSPHDNSCGLPPYSYWDPNSDQPYEGKSSEGFGLILGAFYDENLNQTTICLTKAATLFNHNVDGKLVQLLQSFGFSPKLGEVRTFTQLDPSYRLVTVVGLRDKNAGCNKKETRDEAKENIRKAVGVACRILQSSLADRIFVEGFDDPELAAKGVVLTLWGNQHLRDSEKRILKLPDIVLYDDCDWKKWRIGLEKAEAQNFASKLMETSANHMTPRTHTHCGTVIV